MKCQRTDRDAVQDAVATERSLIEKTRTTWLRWKRRSRDPIGKDIRNHHRKRPLPALRKTGLADDLYGNTPYFRTRWKQETVESDAPLRFFSPGRIVSGINRIGDPFCVDDPDLSWEEKYLDLGALNAPNGFRGPH